MGAGCKTHTLAPPCRGGACPLPHKAFPSGEGGPRQRWMRAFYTFPAHGEGKKREGAGPSRFFVIVILQAADAAHSIALSRTFSGVMSRVSTGSNTALRASTILPASTEWVSQTLPPMTQSLPMWVLPPRIVAPE